MVQGHSELYQSVHLLKAGNPRQERMVLILHV